CCCAPEVGIAASQSSSTGPPLGSSLVTPVVGLLVTPPGPLVAGNIPEAVVPSVAAMFGPDVEALVELPPEVTLLVSFDHVSAVVAPVGVPLVGTLLGVDTLPVPV